MTDQEIKAIALIVLQNCVAIVSFTVLAIIFNCFWIALFSALFIHSVKLKRGEKK